ELPHSTVVAVSGYSTHREDAEVARDEQGNVVNSSHSESATKEKQVNVQFELEVFGDGRIDLRYRLTGKREVKIEQLGMTFILPTAIDRLMWKRQALWSVYPDDHIGRPSGTAQRVSPRTAQISRAAPDWPWAEDMHEPSLDGYQMPAGAA